MRLLDIPDFEGYKADIDTGNIYSLKGKGLKLLSLKNREDGYQDVTLRKDKKSYYLKVHRVIMASYLGTWEWEKPEVNHKNHIRNANWIGNLELATRLEQYDDITRINIGKTSKGRKASAKTKELLSSQRRGNNHPTAILKEADVVLILEQYKNIGNHKGAKTEFRKAMAKQFNVSYSLIESITYRKSWKHLNI